MRATLPSAIRSTCSSKIPASSRASLRASGVPTSRPRPRLEPSVPPVAAHGSGSPGGDRYASGNSSTCRFSCTARWARRVAPARVTFRDRRVNVPVCGAFASAMVSSHRYPLWFRRGVTRAVPVVLVAVLLAGAGAVVASGVPSARAAGSAPLKQRIARGRARVSSLNGTVAADTQRVRQLSGAVAAAASRLDALQRDLTAKLSQLYRLRAQLDAAQTRLSRLRATDAADERVLAAEVVGTYEGGQPNIIDVVLESRGFNDLLDRLEFVQGVGRQDARIAADVKAARRAVAAEAVRLGALSARQQAIAGPILGERNRVGRAQVSLVSKQLAAAQARSSHAHELAGARAQVASLTAQLSRLEAAERAAAPRAPAQRAAQSRLPAASGSGGSG